MKQFYAIKTYKQYDRDVKLAVRRGLDIEKLLTVVDMLRKDEPLPANLHNHISLYRTGTHADIFGKGKKR